jgi:hypothetical protein
MAWFRYSITALMGFVLIVALELAALQSATSEWVEIARFLTVLILVVATYRARFSKGEVGSWWFGFALLGWAYYLLEIEAMRQWARFTYPVDPFVESVPFRALGLFVPDIDMVGWDHSPRAFRVYHQVRIVQSILVLLVASVGGLTCRLLAALRRPQVERTA